MPDTAQDNSPTASDSDETTDKAPAKKAAKKKSAVKRAVKKKAATRKEENSASDGEVQAKSEAIASKGKTKEKDAVDREKVTVSTGSDASDASDESEASAEGTPERTGSDQPSNREGDDRSRNRRGRRGRRGGSGRGAQDDRGPSTDGERAAEGSEDSRPPVNERTGDRDRRDGENPRDRGQRPRGPRERREPREPQLRGPAVPPLKIKEGVKRARAEIVAVLDEITNISSEDDFYVKEIELCLSFDDTGRFIGIGTGGVANVKVILAPDDF